MYNNDAMNNYLKNFLRVLDALDKEQVQYILVGGVAVILHGIERLTRDIDLRYKDKFDAAYLKDFIDIRQNEVSKKGKPKKG